VPLTSPQDPEIDFYLNVAHVQLHRRSRALARIGRLADSMAAEQQQQQQQEGGSGSSMRCLLDIAVPLLQVCALALQGCAAPLIMRVQGIRTDELMHARMCTRMYACIRVRVRICAPAG